MYNPTVIQKYLPEDSELCENEWDFCATLRGLGVCEEYVSDITAIRTLALDGEYLGVWATESNCPWSDIAYFHPLPFFRAAGVPNSPFDGILWDENNPAYAIKEA